MNWRPENWEEHLDRAQSNRIGISWLSDHTYKELMEIGADAMADAILKLLEKLGWQRPADDLRIYMGRFGDKV